MRYFAAVNYILHLWQTFMGLHPWGYIVAASLALVAFVKRKVIGAVASTAQRAAKNKFFGWFSKNLPRENLGKERTYRGIFMGYAQYENPPHEWFFTLVENGVTHKVPTWQSNLLSGVQPGSFVEIDTERIADRSTRHTILAVRESKRTG
jgi:hypothetical protein